MALSTKRKNEPVDVLIVRRFRYFKPDGTMVIYAPDPKGKKPTVASLPYQFAREMEAAGKVSFDLKQMVEVEATK